MTWQEPQDDVPDWRDAYGDYGQGARGQQPPYAQDPYAQGGWTQDPYGQQYAQYGQQQYGQYDYSGYGPPGAMRPAATGATVAALVANIVTAVLCCMGVAWIPGVILAGIALSRAGTDPESARRLTVGAWVCFALDILLAVGVVIVFGLVGAAQDGTTP
ncbi:hypothetical protein [Actinomadura sp. DC4]|uniref:hypothetical protein n=1 Tax=Actinomadura sp. DC4 TaxID=3055069 RepID=UPI0025AF9CE5|nr:hypothetical protein [Actinomadura sp. DC4]MDN3359926.1 hypothetical protein [Actinomadura sp. DC4]